MYIEMKKTGLDVSDLITLVQRKGGGNTGFPYKSFVCRCSNCLYSTKGKCALKECCCMYERIRAHTCTFGEMMRYCFSGIGDNVFQFRLRLAIEREAELKSCFLDAGHRKRFYEGLEIYLKEFATKLSEKIKLNEYKKAQLEADLRTAGMDISPEMYVSNAIVKSVAIGLLAIPAFLIFKLLGLFIAFVAVVMYFSETKKVTKMIAAKRKKIEYELPRLVGSIEKTIKHKKGAVYALESFKDTTCPELKEELEITIADMRSGNEEVALTRLESRVGSTMMSDVTRGLIGVVRGDDMEVYWGTTALKFADYQREQLKAQANAVPRKVRKLSMALLFCFILIYVAVLGQVLLTSMGTLF